MKNKLSKSKRLTGIIELLLYNNSITFNDIKESNLYATILSEEYKDDSTDIAFKRLIERDLGYLLNINLIEFDGNLYTFVNKFKKIKALIIEKTYSLERRDLTDEEFNKEYIEFSEAAVSILDLSEVLAKETTAIRKILQIPGMVDITCMQFKIHKNISVISNYFYKISLYKNHDKTWSQNDLVIVQECMNELISKLGRTPSSILSQVQEFFLNERESYEQGFDITLSEEEKRKNIEAQYEEEVDIEAEKKKLTLDDVDDGIDYEKEITDLDLL